VVVEAVAAQLQREQVALFVRDLQSMAMQKNCRQ
jgi:hypothetical protein